jgi:hypothetical protein
MPNDIVDCPRCGRRQSAWGDGFCGRCEELYRASEEARSRDLYASQRWSEDNPPRPFRVWARERGLI